MIRFFRELWNARRRRIDLQVLWPECKKYARDLEHARIAFAHHVQHDTAWADLDVDHVQQIIGALE